MAATYQAFLASPSASVLAPNASINYITTTTAIHEPAAIVKHLQIQAKQVVKKEEKILYTVESPNGLCVETETTFQFNNGGGAYLPGMDENVIDERIVTFPLVHIVSFDVNGKIAQIRLYWDQGTLLKQVEAIGRTGRNWPIREGQKLVEAVKASVNATGQASNGSNGNGLRNQHAAVMNQHKRGESVTATRDPHASLALFAPRDPNEDSGSNWSGPTVAPRASAKPAPREYGELFAGEETSSGARHSTDPNKIEGRAVKAGAGKNVSGNRLFDEHEEETLATPHGKKTYEQKYDHFAFGNGEDAQRPTSSKGNRKSQATFSFEDFATPPKVTEKNKPDYERHWGAGIDEDDPASVHRDIVHHPRKDQGHGYEIADDSPAGSIKPRSTGTNVDATRRGDDFASKHKSADSSPADTKENARPDRQSVRGELEPTWSAADSPPKQRKIYNTAGDGMGGRKGGGYDPILGETEKKIYKTAGDGMGGRKGAYNPILGEDQKKIYVTAGDGMGGRKTSGRVWGFGDDSDPEVDTDTRSSARGRRGQAGSRAGY